MKKHIAIIFCFLMLSGWSFAQSVSKSYTLEGEILGVENGTKLELTPGATHKKEKPIAETTVENGKFSFSGKLDEPRLFYLQIAGTYAFTSIMLENAPIKLKAKVEHTVNNGQDTWNFSEVEIKGSETQKLYEEKIAFKDTLNQKYEDYHKRHKDVSDALAEAYREKNKAKTDSIHSTEAYKAFEKDEKEFFNTVKSTSERVVFSNKETYWGPLLMLLSWTYFTPNEKPIYESFSQAAKDSYYGQIVYKELFPERLVGKTVPSFELPDKDGNAKQLTTLVQGKKYFLIDFWASWCAPCRKEIPNLKRIYDEFSSKGLQIVSISIDKKQADWLKALTAENMAWPNLWDNKDVNDAFMVKTIPALFLVDKNGKVVADDLRGDALYEKLKELF